MINMQVMIHNISITVFEKNESYLNNILNSIEKLLPIDFNKEKIVKRIELIETHEEQVRPLILHCKYCKSWFESDKFNYLCPVCGNDRIYAAYLCINCQKWYFKNEPSEDYYCKNKKCEGIRLIRREREEIKHNLNQKGTLLRKYEIKNKKFSILDS